MSVKLALSEFNRGPDGAFTCDYASYTLLTAFQPIAEPSEDGLVIAGYNGQIRIERGGDHYAPSEFLTAIDPGDMAFVDATMAALHLYNARLFRGQDVTIHVARNPRHFHTLQDMRDDAEALRLHAAKNGIAPGNIVCELRLRENDDIQRASQYAGHLRRAGFKIGLDGYAGEDIDRERMTHMRPNYVRFEPTWVAGFLASSAGLALLRVIIQQFKAHDVITLFHCLEDEEALEKLQRIGAERLQGHAIARPEQAPATFTDRFHVRRLERMAATMRAAESRAPVQSPSISQQATAAVDDLASRRVQRRPGPVFGKRGRV